MRYHFLDLGVTFTFYNWYASFHGFAGRKSKIMRNQKGENVLRTEPVWSLVKGLIGRASSTVYIEPFTLNQTYNFPISQLINKLTK
jgi:hypothetical protein